MTAQLSLDDMLTLDAEAADLLFREARTANTFSDVPVTEEQARAIFELAKMGPTAMNLQSLRVTWVRSPEARARLVDCMGGNNKAKTSTAPLVAVLSADPNWHEHLPVTFAHAEGLKEAFDDQEETRTAMARDNAFLAAGYFIMAVRAAGLAAGPMSGFDAAAVDAAFNAATGHKAIMVVNIGRPGENPWFDRLPRLDWDDATITV